MSSPNVPRRTQIWMSTSEACQKLGLRWRELDKMIRDGELEFIKRGHYRLVKTADVKALYLRRLAERSNL